MEAPKHAHILSVGYCTNPSLLEITVVFANKLQTVRADDWTAKLSITAGNVVDGIRENEFQYFENLFCQFPNSCDFEFQ